MMVMATFGSFVKNCNGEIAIEVIVILHLRIINLK